MANYPKPFTALPWTVTAPRAFAGSAFQSREVVFPIDDNFAFEEAETRGLTIHPMTCGYQNLHGYSVRFATAEQAVAFLRTLP